MKQRRVMEAEAMKNQECPKCGSDEVRRSQMQGLMERVLRLIGFRAYRCERCDDRYYKFRGKINAEKVDRND